MGSKYLGYLFPATFLTWFLSRLSKTPRLPSQLQPLGTVRGSRQSLVSARAGQKLFGLQPGLTILGSRPVVPFAD